MMETVCLWKHQIHIIDLIKYLLNQNKKEVQHERDREDCFYKE